jgi:hypothetical protein
VGISDVNLEKLKGTLEAEGVEGGWQKDGLALAEGETLTAVVAELTAASQSDEGDEGVEVGVIDGHRVVKIVDSDGEAGTTDELDTLILQGGVRHLVIVGVGVLVVAEVVGDVGGIPNLGDETVAAGGMHLKGETLTGVNQLNKQREFVAKTPIVLLSHESSAQLMYKLAEGLSVVRSSTDDGLAVSETREFPAFADMANLQV